MNGWLDIEQFGVYSEVGKLRKVIVHRPELSLKRLTPTNHDDLLFDRFTSVVMDESFRGLEHGIDERIPIAAMAKMVKFYAQLMQVWGTKEMISSERSKP